MKSPVSVLQVPPQADLISLGMIRNRVRREEGEDDETLTLLQAAALSQLDGSEGILGRALVAQTWADHWRGFPPGGRLPIALAPVIGGISISYFDAGNVERVLPAEGYRMHKDHAGNFYLRMLSGAFWPSTYDRDDAVTVTYQAGYGADASDVPAAIRLAALEMIAHWYETDTHEADRAVPASQMDMLRRYIRPHF